jgi:hypothetical protein
MAIPLIAAGAAGGGAMAGAGGAAAGGGFWAWLQALLAKGGMGAAAGGGGGAAGASGVSPQLTQGGMNLAKIGSQFSVPGVTNGTSGATSPTGGEAGGNMGALKQWDNRNNKVNSIFAGLRTFGTAFGGPDKTGLNGIPRNQPPIIYPQNNQNPGLVQLMQLMQQIQAGGR